MSCELPSSLSGSTPTSWLWGLIPMSYRTFDLSTNYSGSYLALADFLTTQVHELGHSLAQILGLAPKGTEDPYASKLEDCVIQKMLGGQRASGVWRLLVVGNPFDRRR